MEIRSQCIIRSSLADLADCTALHLFAQVMTVIFWGVMVTDSWITVDGVLIGEARLKGRLHLAGMLFPLPYLVFYIYLQGMAGNSSEMSGFIVMSLLPIIHTLRTFWQLRQLEQFTEFCVHGEGIFELMKCLRIGSRRFHRIYSTQRRFSLFSWVSRVSKKPRHYDNSTQARLRREVDENMYVNDTIVKGSLLRFRFPPFSDIVQAIFRFRPLPAGAFVEVRNEARVVANWIIPFMHCRGDEYIGQCADGDPLVDIGR